MVELSDNNDMNSVPPNNKSVHSLNSLPYIVANYLNLLIAMFIYLYICISG